MAANQATFFTGASDNKSPADVDKIANNMAASVPSILPVTNNPAEPQEVRVLNQSSITLSKNTKGFNWDIKIYTGTTHDDINKLFDQIMAVNDKLKKMLGE